MATHVEFAKDCQFDFGELSPDEVGLVTQYLRWLAQHLREFEGMPHGARRLSDGPPDKHILEDDNWAVTYEVVRRKRKLRRTVTLVAIRRVRLKKRPWI